MSEPWPTVTLAEVAAIAFSGVDKHIIPGETLVRLCNYLDVYRNRRLTKGTSFTEGSATSVEIRRLELRKGDVIITKDSETPDDIGIPSMVEDDLSGVICGYHLALLRPDNRKLASGFLLHFLQSDASKRHFLRTANGLTRFGLGARSVSSLPIALPPLNEQAAIAGVLDAVDAAIDRVREAATGAKELQRAVIQQFFYSALGVTAYADHPAQKLPVGWQLLPTEALLAEDPKNGVSPKATAQPPRVPTFSIAAIRDGKIDLTNASNLKYAKVSDRIAEKFRINTGDVLVVRGNANPDLVGKAGRVGDFPEGCIYPDITKRIVFRRNGEDTVSPDYAVLAWNHPVVHNQVLRRAKTSNGTLKINNRDVRQIVLPVPPEKAQNEIVSLVAAVDSKVVALNQKVEALQQLKRSLMRDLLTGTVRVSPALFQADAAA
jgi:type I restriction enzyme, S subunit